MAEAELRLEGAQRQLDARSLEVEARGSLFAQREQTLCAAEQKARLEAEVALRERAELTVQAHAMRCRVSTEIP